MGIIAPVIMLNIEKALKAVILKFSVSCSFQGAYDVMVNVDLMACDDKRLISVT